VVQTITHVNVMKMAASDDVKCLCSYRPCNIASNGEKFTILMHLTALFQLLKFYRVNDNLGRMCKEAVVT